MRLLFVYYLFVGTVICIVASAEGLPANPWLNAEPTIYTAEETQSASVQKEQKSTAGQPTIVNINFNILMNFFASPFQSSPNASYAQSGAVADFLKNIHKNDVQKTNRQTRRSSSLSAYPLSDAADTYNQYMAEMKQKYNNTKQSVEDYYNDKMNTLTNMQRDATRSIKKLLK